jgi:hypothetical protein
MLSLLKADCTPKDLEAALNEAMDRADALQQQKQEPKATSHQSPRHAAKEADRDEEEAFVAEMTDAGFSRNLALKALAAVGAENTIEGED